MCKYCSKINPNKLNIKTSREKEKKNIYKNNEAWLCTRPISYNKHNRKRETGAKVKAQGKSNSSTATTKNLLQQINISKLANKKIMKVLCY